MKNGLLIGIDGGGTHSTAVAAWPSGQVAAVAYGDGLNFHNIGVEKVRRRLESMVEELCEKTGAQPLQVCVGMSALDAPADEATLLRFTGGLFTPQMLDLQSDAYIALMGFTQGQPGMIAICGTGSMLLLADEMGGQHVSGGWGYLLGDAGSGYTLAREGILSVIDAVEGLSAPTPLTAHACAFFGVDDPRKMIDRIYAPDFTPDQLAGFARHVLAEAERGDAAARAILTRNMDRLARQAAQLLTRAPKARRVGLYGGIFAHSEAARNAFCETLTRLAPQAEPCSLEYPPELGAIIHLLHKNGSLTADALAQLKLTYKEILR